MDQLDRANSALAELARAFFNAWRLYVARRRSLPKDENDNLLPL